MARISLPAQGRRKRRRAAPIARLVLLLVPAGTGCATYEPDPIDPSAMLADLAARRWDPPAAPGDPAAADPEQLASFAVAHHPALAAARARIGVARSLLVEAGLLADPAIGWNGMDALAAEIVEGRAASIDFLTGLGLSIPLPRPGEIDARTGVARGEVEEARRRVVQAEWTLAREVHLACEDLLELEGLLEQNLDLVQVAESTRDYFARAMAAGAATAIQANLAAGDLLAIRAERVRLEARRRDARHRLNALLGLPPETAVPVRAGPRADDGPPEAPPPNVEELVASSLSRRPDLAALFASYQAAEEAVRLEVSRQFPLAAVGTGITLEPGLFTRFNRPAIATALARRAALRAEIEAQVHEARREIQDAFAAREEAHREVRFLASELLPNAEESLRLAGEAFASGEVTVLEILTLQRNLVDARTRTTEARAELQRRHWRLLAASGTLLPPGDAPDSPTDRHETAIR
ncbi:MAG: TolC family protein [Planctomycetota bacterium]